MNLSSRSREEILFGVPQGSILGPLLFSIFLCDLSFIMNENDFSSQADDKRPYGAVNTINEVIQSVEHDTMMLLQWFSDNQMKANIIKCRLPVNKKDEVAIRIGDTEIKNSEYEKLLGIKVDTNLNFNEHLNYTISKASRKVNALLRVIPYMSLSKKKKTASLFF